MVQLTFMMTKNLNQMYQIRKGIKICEENKGKNNTLYPNITFSFRQKIKYISTIYCYFMLLNTRDSKLQLHEEENADIKAIIIRI